MEKVLKIGKPAVISFSGEAATNFEVLPKSEQISYIADNLSPSGDIVRATQLLKGVKHGADISSGNVKTNGKDNTNNPTSKGDGTGGERSKSGASESKD